MKDFQTIVEIKSKLTNAEWRAVCMLGAAYTLHFGHNAEHSYFVHEADRIAAANPVAV